MKTEENHPQFDGIVQMLTQQYPQVKIGKMMSSAALKVNDKVFTFYHEGSMGFRLGANFDTQKFEVLTAKPLSPFKTKPPLKGWYMVFETESNQWEILAQMALEFTQTLK